MAVKRCATAKNQRSFAKLTNYLISIVDVIHINEDLFKEDMMIELWCLIKDVRDANKVQPKQVCLDFSGLNSESAPISRKCMTEGVKIWSINIENQTLDYDWGLKYLCE